MHLDPLPAGKWTAVKIDYETTKDAKAFSWLKAEQTTSGKLPFMFTQCEPIHCRTIAPMQDTPAIKQTWSALVTIPNEHTVVMSATKRTEVIKFNDTHSTYTFNQSIPVPSYLLAIAVGEIEHKLIGDSKKVGVYAEPANLDKCAEEFANLPDLVKAARDYLDTDYPFPTYDILVLPPSFPYGGMENPQLTFASPTIVVGDKSQVYVATHEIVHSWFGNDITCENWSNMWLNEGFTVFGERKVSAQFNGQDFAMMEAQLGNTALRSAMADFPPKSSFSSLYPELHGVDPDTSYSEVCYEKGFQFLVYLESLINDDKTDNMKAFLNFYLKTYAGQSINYLQLKTTYEAFVNANIVDETKKAAALAVDWDLWIKTPGMPDTTKFTMLDFTTKNQTIIEGIADQFIAAKGGENPKDATKENWGLLNSLTKTLFLDRLLAKRSTVVYEVIKKIDQTFDITNEKNPELLQRWLPLAIMRGYLPAFAKAKDFVSAQGRMKYLQPIF